MLEFLFGETASTALRAASPRLLAWSQGFESWIAEMERTRHPKETKKAIWVWRAFLKECARPPWEVTQADVSAHIAGRQAAGKAHNTIRHDVIKLSQFYKWMGRARLDPQTGADFNPAAALRMPRIETHAHLHTLSQAEARMLLDAFLRQGSPLSLRDHAFIKIRLCLGRHFYELQRLRWGQIETRADGPWVRWDDGRDELLEYDAFAALLHYLRKSGRLESMAAESYLFVPLKHGGQGGGRAEDWNGSRPIGEWLILYNLKRFGHVAGIPPEKLTIQALRHTAICRRLEAGASVEHIQAFMGAGRLADVRAYLRKLPHPPERPLDPGRLEDASAITREAHHFALGDGLIHGNKAMRQPEEEVLAIIAEGIHGVKAELKMMRQLQRKLMHMASQAQTDQEQDELHEAVSMIGGRMATMRKIDRQLARFRNLGHPLADFQAVENRLAEQEGRPPDKVVLKVDGENGEQDDWEGLEEEIASSRLVARKACAHAMESDNPHVVVYHAQIFGLRCMRMARLEQIDMAQRQDLEEQLGELIESLLEQVMEENNIHL